MQLFAPLYSLLLLYYFITLLCFTEISATEKTREVVDDDGKMEVHGRYILCDLSQYNFYIVIHIRLPLIASILAPSVRHSPSTESLTISTRNALIKIAIEQRD